MSRGPARIWIAGAAIVALSGAGVAVAATQDDPEPTSGKKNSAGCVPSTDGVDAKGPDACGPGNYPMWRFHRDAEGNVAISCADDVRGAPKRAPVAEGEPDPSCHPMSEADLRADAARAKKIEDDMRNGRVADYKPEEGPKQ